MRHFKAQCLKHAEMHRLSDLITQDTQLFLIGAGKMGGALLHGWLKAGLVPQQFLIQDPLIGEDIASLALRHNPSAQEIEAYAPSIIILAVKPQMASEVLPALAVSVPQNALIISLMAGVTIKNLQNIMGDCFCYVRTMPNTPASIGQGITALYAQNTVSRAQKDIAQALMQAVGAAVWLEHEADIDIVTALSGSGPAYIYYITEAMAAIGAEMGLSPDTAMRLARTMVQGTGAMLAQHTEEVALLREHVTSKGGTTHAALQVLMDKQTGMMPLMRRAMQAAAQRARDLS